MMQIGLGDVKTFFTSHLAKNASPTDDLDLFGDVIFLHRDVYFGPNDPYIQHLRW
jgi:hypothetical protein